MKKKLKRNLCECGCGQACYNRFVVGHNSVGKKHSEEVKRKMSESHKGKTAWNKGKVGVSDETRKRMVKASTGRKWSEESKLKFSRMRRGRNNPMYGKNHTNKSKRKIGQAFKGKKLSKEHILKRTLKQMRCRTDSYCDAWSDFKYKEDLRKDICDHCGMTNEEHLKKWNRILSLHHIDGDKKNCHPDNFITLCVRCHAVADWKLRKPLSKDSRGRWV